LPLTVRVPLFCSRSLSSLLVIALSIPVSVVTAFTILDSMGWWFTIVMLAGLAFSIGNVAGNSIVVRENTFQHRERAVSAVTRNCRRR
jgi:HAE1 family hydrophobic/amphiphilic exporter-1